MYKILTTLLLGLIISTVACVGGGGKHMTNEIVMEHGTKIYKADYKMVWEAVKGTLVTDGYYLAYVNPKKGIINTRQKLIRSFIGNNGQASSYYRQYLVTVIAISKTEVKVTLSPKLFAGNTDITGEKVWVIDGKDGEILLWEKFFKDVSNLL